MHYYLSPVIAIVSNAGRFLQKKQNHPEQNHSQSMLELIMDIHGYQWITMDIHGYLCISMDIQGYP